jgi:hypothetical protein
MKYWMRHALWLVAAVLVWSGCERNKEEPQATPGGHPAAVERPAEEGVLPALAPVLSAVERVARLGFVQRLPADTESVIAVYRGGELVQRLKELKGWKLLAEQGALAELGGLAGSADGEGVTPGSLLGEEFFLAVGPGSGEQAANLLRLNTRRTHFQLRGMVKMLADKVAGGGGDPAAAINSSLQIFGDLLKDPESGIGLLEKSAMPPVLIGFKVAAGRRDGVAQQIAAGLEMLGTEDELVEPVSIERGGGKFTGYRIVGAKVAALLRENAAEGMGELLDPAAIERLIEALSTKNLVLASGVLGDYVLIFAGSSEDQFRLAGSVEDSLGGSAGFAFMDEFAGKEIVGLVYGAAGLLEGVYRDPGGLKVVAGGIREGLAETNAFGDTRDIEALLQVVAEREDAVMATLEHATLGLVVFREDGLRLESFGGSGSPRSMDSVTPHSLAGLGAGDDVVLFSNWVGNPEYNKLTRAYLEAIAETGYAMAAKASTLDQIDDPRFGRFRDGFKLFDGRLRPHVLKMWDVLSGSFVDGVGAEGALVVDLGGSVPPVAGVPQGLVDDGVAPRVSLVCPVVDRAKLAESWRGLDAASRELLKVAGEITGQEIPMQKPMSSEKDRFKTWFFAAPFFTDDFVPSVTLDDQWLVASTSKVKALDLLGRLGQPVAQRTGAWTRVDFDALVKFGGAWLAVLDKHGPAVFKGNDPALAEFRERRPLIERALEAAEDLDELTMHGRYVDGRMRMSVHLNVK